MLLSVFFPMSVFLIICSVRSWLSDLMKRFKCINRSVSLMKKEPGDMQSQEIPEGHILLCRFVGNHVVAIHGLLHALLSGQLTQSPTSETR